MHFIAIAFLLGDLYVQTLSTLFSNNVLIMIIIISAIISVGFRCFVRYYYYYYLPLVFATGLVWSTWYANSVLLWSLPKELEGKSIWVTGYIASLPVKNRFGSRFEFTLDEIKDLAIKQNPEGTGANIKELRLLNSHRAKNKIRLSWQNNTLPLQVGAKYKLLVRLKRIHATQNPGTFDFEAWSFQKEIRAIGYVVANKDNKLLSHQWFAYPVEQLRQALQHKLSTYLPSSPTSPWLMALIIGERNGISQEDWQVLRNTGTNHLMAIGGLHIGILAGFIYYLATWCWRRIPWLVLRIPASQAGMSFALLMTMIYSTFAGFSIPTQRASLMFIICILALLSRRKIKAWHAWSLALSIGLLCHPLIVLSESFWLSFGTIALIIYGTGGRLASSGWWWKWGRVQWVISLGLLPLTLALFQECSLISFVANCVAIPWMEFLILPFCFLSSILLFIFPAIAQLLLYIADKSLSVLWAILSWFAHFHFFTWHLAIPNQMILILTILGLLLLLAPAGFPGRWMGLIWLMPLLLYKPLKPILGDVWVTVLDVGQGLSVIVQTKEHTLIYDTGPKYADQFNAGESIVVPYLRTLGISRIDKLVISHRDNDHSGGAKAILDVLPVIDVSTSVPDQFASQVKTTLCLSGQTWRWDQVNFSFIYPTEDKINLGNDSSCVLRIDNGQHSLLLSGDIEKKGEEDLVKRIPEKLATSILVAPHHGSKTSGLANFISNVHPNIVIYSTGYRNRYHFPHASIVAAYKEIDATQLNTMETGAIQFKMEKNNKKILFDLYRLTHKHYWLD